MIRVQLQTPLSALIPLHVSAGQVAAAAATRHQSGLKARTAAAAAVGNARVYSSDSHGHAPQAPPPMLQLPLAATMVAVPLLPVSIVALIRLIRRFVLFESE